MTSQVNLERIWASTGSMTDPLDVNYDQGWISEIPTFEEMNYVLNAIDNNILVIAESGIFDWQSDINYKAGTSVRSGVNTYFCKANNINQLPALDTTGNYWVLGTIYGGAATSLLLKNGVKTVDINPRASGNVWDGSDYTIENASPLIQLTTSGAGTKNWVFGNVAGEVVVIDVDTTTQPDGRDISLGGPDTKRVFHEGHYPTYQEVVGAIPDSAGSIANDGKYWARRNNNWFEVTTTSVQDEPPPPVLGLGQGWFNLADGQLYIDIDDGSSSQWAPANPPVIPTIYKAEDVSYDNSSSGLTATNMQDAIDELAALHP